MGRYTGPVEKLSRREGVDLELKGERMLRGKGALERRGDRPPGQHGQRNTRRQSTYGVQLREKQRAKRFYGVRERQFRRVVNEAHRRRDGVTGTWLLVLLEQRLDNVVFRLGFASTRAQARQFVNHGHVTVDGARVDIASYSVQPGQVVAIGAESPIRPLVLDNSELMSRVGDWLEVDYDSLQGRVLRLPTRSEIAIPVDEQLIIEFYSRR